MPYKRKVKSKPKKRTYTAKYFFNLEKIKQLGNEYNAVL